MLWRIYKEFLFIHIIVCNINFYRWYNFYRLTFWRWHFDLYKSFYLHTCSIIWFFRIKYISTWIFTNVDVLNECEVSILWTIDWICLFLIKHTNRQLMTKLFKILNFYEIRNKFFDVVIDNVNNNKILKKKFEKTMIFHNFSWNRKQNAIFCFVHVVNLMIQNFIKIIDFEIVNNLTFTSLKNDQIKSFEKKNNLSQMIKKIKLNW